MELDYKIKEVQEEADSGHDKDLLSISLKNAYPNDKDLNTIVPYSRTKDVYYKDDPNSNEVKQIHFTTEQREIINTLDRCYKQKRNILNLDAFICNYYNSANYEVKPEERQHFLRALNEFNATRFADAQNTRDIIQSQSNGTQAILDKLCQLELDGVKAQVDAKNDRIAELQTQLNMANLAASQTAQNAFIAQGFANEVDQLYNRLSNCPVPTTPVYGRTPIFTCPQNVNAGCGCNGSF